MCRGLLITPNGTAARFEDLMSHENCNCFNGKSLSMECQFEGTLLTDNKAKNQRVSPNVSAARLELSHWFPHSKRVLKNLISINATSKLENKSDKSLLFYNVYFLRCVANTIHRYV